MNIYSLILRLAIVLLCIPHSGKSGSGDEFDRFYRQCADLARSAEKTGSIAVAGQKNWFFLAGELRYLGARQFWGAAAATVLGN